MEKGSFGARNIIVGDTEKASVVYTAHYDTCPALPFPNFITPKKLSIYLLYQIILTLGIIFAATMLGVLVGVVIGVFIALANVDFELIEPFIPLITYACFIAIFMLFLNGPANKHTANDNTSGVVTLLEIMRKMPQSIKTRKRTSFL